MATWALVNPVATSPSTSTSRDVRPAGGSSLEDEGVAEDSSSRERTGWLPPVPSTVLCERCLPKRLIHPGTGGCRCGSRKASALGSCGSLVPHAALLPLRTDDAARSASARAPAVHANPSRLSTATSLSPSFRHSSRLSLNVSLARS